MSDWGSNLISIIESYNIKSKFCVVCNSYNIKLALDSLFRMNDYDKKKVVVVYGDKYRPRATYYIFINRAVENIGVINIRLTIKMPNFEDAQIKDEEITENDLLNIF